MTEKVRIKIAEEDSELTVSYCELDDYAPEECNRQRCRFADICDLPDGDNND